MCLILFAWQSHPDYRLILSANRDEFYERPTRPAHWWEEHEELLAGRDLQAGGTWMGVTKSGKFAAITNYRQFPITRKYETSRGALVRDYLIDDWSPEAYLAELREKGDQYEGFNLLFGTTEQLFYFSNMGGHEGALDKGIYGLSNHLLDTPWPKVSRGKEAFARKVTKTQQSTAPYFDLMLNKELAEDNDLPDTGIGHEKEKWLSAMFIESPGYGTRNSTVLMIGADRQFHLEERGWVPPSSSAYQFKIR